MTDSDHHDRAAKIFGADGGDIRWPYGLETPHPRRSGLTGEQLQQAADHARVAQRLIVEWAEQYGITASRSGCCPRWLQRNASRRCSATCYRPGADYAWLDHPIYWLRNRRPAVITSALYYVGDEDRDRITWWTEQHPLLRAAFGTGWYGHGTTQIVLWRTDRAPEVAPAGFTLDDPTT